MKTDKASVSYHDGLIKDLKDPKEAMLYLNACVQVAFEEDEPELVILAIYDVAQAQGIQKTAHAAKMHRISFHRILAEGGNPKWKSLFRVLSALHLAFRFDKLLSKAA